ncbi:mCG146234, partial [Mus musculus]
YVAVIPHLGGMRCMPGKALQQSTRNTHCFVLSRERQLCLRAAQSQEGLLVLSMCGPKKQGQTSCPNLKLMSSLPAPEPCL